MSVVACVRLSICPSESTNLFAYPCNNCLAKLLITYANGLLTQCMKRPVAHSLNSNWFWIELPENCCEPLKFIMKYISIQFCEQPGHGRPFHALLTHWGRVTHICVGNLTIIGSDNGLWPDWRQAIIWTNARILLIGPLGTNFIEMLIEIHTFSFKKKHLKLSSG